MSGEPGACERVLASLERELQPLGQRARRRALDEARDHLLSAIDDAMAGGAPREQAEARAVERFGDPARIAETLVIEHSRAARSAWRILAALAMAAGALAVQRLGVRTGVADPGAAVDDGASIAIVLVLASLPWLAGWQRAFGRMAGGRAALLTRVGVLGALAALPFAAADVRRFAGARLVAPGHAVHAGIGGSVLIAVLVTLYATGIVWVTSRRGGASAATLAIGACAGAVSGLAVYALAPFGSALHVDPWLQPVAALGLGLAALGTPLLAGRLAGDRTAGPGDAEALSLARMAQGMRAGLCCAIVATLIIVVLTLPTMAHFPHDVALKWANPDPNVPHGGAFEVRMSVGDGAPKYVLLLFAGPLLGAALGVAGGDLRRKPRAAQPLLEADRLAADPSA